MSTTFPMSKPASMTTRVVLGAHVLLGLAPHLHGLDVIEITVNPYAHGTRLTLQTRAVIDASELVSRLLNASEDSQAPSGDDVEVSPRGDYVHAHWSCTWQGYDLSVVAAESLTPTNAPQENKEPRA